MKLTRLMLALVAPALAACTTTEEANQALKSRFVGQPSDAFFTQYGAPLSEFSLNNSGKVYRWRGGETTRTLPAEYTTIGASDPMAGKTTTKTTTTVSQPNSSTTVTETRTTSSGVTFGGGPQQVMVKPPRVEALFCEAQISTDANGIITSVEATRDTDGQGFSLSRCAEVFGVGK